jgi:hypothetical protein
MNESELETAILIELGISDFKLWTIGITEDPQRLKGELEAAGKDVKHWRYWKADSEAVARSVEAYFLDKGMKGGTSDGDHPAHVYVF